jgi:hypothetical protein
MFGHGIHGGDAPKTGVARGSTAIRSLGRAGPDLGGPPVPVAGGSSPPGQLGRQMPGPMTPTPQHLSPPAAGRANPLDGGDPVGVCHADRLWIALTLARAGDTPTIRAYTEDAVFRFYLPMARALARSSAQYPDDPEGADQAAELGLAQAVLAWRYPSGQGFDRAAAAAITNHLRQAPEPPHISPERPPPPGGRPADHPIDE